MLVSYAIRLYIKPFYEQMRGKLIKARTCEKTVAADLQHAGMCVAHQAHVYLQFIQKHSAQALTQIA